MATREPGEHAGPGENPGGGLLARLKRLFGVGPFGWMTRSLPASRRFRAGERLHGLERRDVEPRGEGELGGTGVQDVPVARSPEPPAR